MPTLTPVRSRALTPRRAAAPAISVKANAPAATPAKVPGEMVRSTLAAASGIISPLASGGQLIGLLSHIGFLGRLLAPVAHFLALPPVASALQGLEKVFPWIKLGVLGFDAYAAHATLKHPDASSKRKWAVCARLACSALATGLAFVPRWGALASKVPSYMAIAADVYVKKMNLKGEA